MFVCPSFSNDKSKYNSSFTSTLILIENASKKLSEYLDSLVKGTNPMEERSLIGQARDHTDHIESLEKQLFTVKLIAARN
jgi:hypothetical protein